MSLPDCFHIAWQNDAAVYRANDAWHNMTWACDQTVEDAYPLTNMQSVRPNLWAAIDMAGETTAVLTDVDSEDDFRTANCFALHNHNLPAGTTVRLQLYDAINQGGSEVFDSDDIEGLGTVENTIPMGADIASIDPVEGAYEEEARMKLHFSMYFPAVLYKSAKVTITNADGFTNDVILIDKLWLAYAHSFDYGPSNGWTWSLDESGDEQMRLAGGGYETINGGVTPRMMRVPFELLTQMERHVYRYIMARNGGKANDLLITMDPNDVRSLKYETTSIYCRLSDQSFVARIYNGNNTDLALGEN